MRKKILILLILLFTSNFSVLSQVNTQNIVDRPPSNGAPTRVIVFAAILNVNEIDPAAQKLTSNVYFVATWKDVRLAHEGPLNLIKPIDEIWNPKLAIINRQDITTTMPNIAVIHPDGTVIFRQRVFGEFSQTLDFKEFPFDRQKFAIKIVASGYGPEEIEFSSDSVQQSVISNELTIMNWDIVSLDNIVRPYSIVPGIKPIASITFEITADRKSSYYMYKFLIPLILIILMSMAVFWLDPQLPAPQISVSVTSMLTLIAYRFMIADSLPKISYLTRMDLFILCSTIMIFITLSEAVLTAALAKRNKEILANRIDLYSRWIFPAIYTIIFLIAFVIY